MNRPRSGLNNKAQGRIDKAQGAHREANPGHKLRSPIARVPPKGLAGIRLYLRKPAAKTGR